MTTNFQKFGENLGSLSVADKTYSVLNDCFSFYKTGGIDISASATCLRKTADGLDISYNTMLQTSVLKSDLGPGFDFNTTNTYGNLTSRYFTASGRTIPYNDLIQNMSIINNIGAADSSFNTYHSNNMAAYKKMKEKRDGLDIKMRELYNDETTDNMTMQNSSIYMNVTLTVLATSLVYLLFAKL